MAARSIPENGELWWSGRTRETASRLRPAHRARCRPVHRPYRDAALATGLRIAELQRGRVWLTNGDYDFSFVENFHVPSSV